MAESPADRAHTRISLGCERFTPSDGPRWDLAFDLASAVVGAVVLLLVASTFRDYGITWDETWHLTYGRHVIHWYYSGFTDDSALSYRADYLYGGSFDGLGYLAREFSPLDRYATIHLFGALLGCVGLLGAWKFGRLLGGAAGGFVTLVLLVLTPGWYGQMFNNPKDMPFAVGYVWALYYEVRILLSMPAVPKREWVKASIALGAAMSVRIAGLLTLCYLYMIVGLWVWFRAREARDLRLIPRYLLKFSPKLIGATLGAWALMLVFWPWAQLNPLTRPLIALARMSAFNLHERGMPFGERRVSTLTPPPDYMLRYFAFTLPELVLFLAIGAMVVLIVRALRLRKHAKAERLGLPPPGPAPAPDERRRVALGLFLLFTILFPDLYAIAKRSPLYDGLRHFLFLVPILVIVAGVALTKLVRELAARGRAGVPAVHGALRARVAAWALRVVFVAHCARMIVMMVHLHPHQYLSFNYIIALFHDHKGGLAGAYLHYDTDYYGNTYKEGFETLRRYLWEHERERYLAGTYTVEACMPEFIAAEYLGSNFELRRSGGKPPDFYLGYTRNDCYLKYPDAPELTRVEREDTLLVLIRDVRPTHPPAPSKPTTTNANKSRAEAHAKAMRNRNARNKPGGTSKPGTPKPGTTAKKPGTTTKKPGTAPKQPVPTPEKQP